MTRTQQARREDILQAAITVINRDGYAQASVDRIAAEAGTSKSTVLYHFKTRQAINEALIDGIYQIGAFYMKPIMEGESPAREKLRTYLSANLKFIWEHVRHIAAVQKVLQDVPPRDYNASLIQWLSRIFEKGQENGELGHFDPTIMAAMVRSIVDSVSFHVVANPSLDMNTVTHEIVQLFDKAIRPD